MQIEQPNQTPEPLEQPADLAGGLAPYFPDYLDGVAATSIQLIVFHAFLLVFAVKLVKWGGRAWLMGTTFARDKQIRVRNYDGAEGGTASVRWPEQFSTVVGKAFRDWCWPSEPNTSSKLHEYLNHLAGEIGEAATPIATPIAGFSADPDRFRPCVDHMARCLEMLIEYLDIKDGIYDNKLIGMGASAETNNAVGAVRNSLNRQRADMRRVLADNNAPNPERFERCETIAVTVSECANALRSIANSGHMSDYYRYQISQRTLGGAPLSQ